MDNDVQKLWESYNNINDTDIIKILDNIKPSNNLKSYINLVTYVEDRLAHDYRYAIDCEKINKELNWKPKVSFQEGIKKTVKWYLKNIDWLNKVKMKNKVLSKMDNE